MTREPSTPALFDDPNRYTRPASLEIYDHSATFHGYQEFRLTKDAVHPLPGDLPLRRKFDLLSPYFTPRFMGKRSILDLGANSGFFCFWALQNGAVRATAVDMDEQYVSMIEQARSALDVGSIETAKANVVDWKEPADVVLALALVHWIYSCTALYGTLDATVGMLAELTGYMLIVEWVEPADPAIEFFGHIEWNKEVVHGAYDRVTFERALSAHFPRWERGPDISATRTMYVAYTTAHELDLTSPLPLLHDESTVIYSRLLSTYRGVEYWSRVYDTGDSIEKQTSVDLAAREGRLLSKLTSPSFPRVLGSFSSDDGFSVVTLERVEGIPLAKEVATITGSVAAFMRFVRQSFGILEELRDARIVHRDIQLDNFIMRDGKPVLIDFGWAISDEEQYVATPGLGREGRPPDGSFSDVFALGVMLRGMGSPSRRFDPVLELMTDAEPALRISDLKVLRVLFESVAAEEETG
jgi:SAM-dependent methyltransferase